MIRLEARADGVLLCVRATPGARRNGLCGEKDGALKVSVTQVAEKGKANKAVIEVLCKSLGLKKSQIEMISGETSRDKQLVVREVTAEDLRARIEAAANLS